jgi:hypothetical protein
MTLTRIGADADGAIWSIAETTLAVVSACLPTLKPLVNYLFRGQAKDQSHPASTPLSYGPSARRPKPDRSGSLGKFGVNVKPGGEWDRLEGDDALPIATNRDFDDQGRQGSGSGSVYELRSVRGSPEEA